MQQTVLDGLLGAVERPARYSGGEYNAVVKEDAALRFALCFPDVYEIGMSHLGSRILYHVLNQERDVACERVYAPWPDMERALLAAGEPLFSLETRRPLRAFDIVGFSLLYEMCYTNILAMLALSNIPFDACERGEDMPLLVAGGPCCCNPEPIAPFFDAILLGDGEELILDVVNAVRTAKAEGVKKPELLRRLKTLRGVYVPSLYEAGETVVKRIVEDLDGATFTGEPVVPYMDIVHDRVALEVMRGCTRGCRFCQAGYIYRPVRERKRETVMQQAREQIACTGYDEVSLLSLSTGDYSEVHALVPQIIREMEAGRVSVSLPSLRVDAALSEDFAVMRSVRKAGLTFAPEAGTQRLRDVINKNVTEDDILRAATDAFRAGWSSVKLYFMLGLPTETDEDILGIATLAKKVSDAFYAVPKEARGGKGLRINVSVSTFVPKPFTAFQWCAQNSLDEIRSKQALLREAMRGVRGAQLSCHLSQLSVLEAAFSRGDRRLAGVLVSAYRRGCRFDSWTEHFQPAAWAEAFAENGLTAEAYAQQGGKPGDPLPWDFVDMLVTQDYLKREYEKAFLETTTGYCRNRCNGCFGAAHMDECGWAKVAIPCE